MKKLLFFSLVFLQSIPLHSSEHSQISVQNENLNLDIQDSTDLEISMADNVEESVRININGEEEISPSLDMQQGVILNNTSNEIVDNYSQIQDPLLNNELDTQENLLDLRFGIIERDIKNSARAIKELQELYKNLKTRVELLNMNNNENILLNHLRIKELEDEMKAVKHAMEHRGKNLKKMSECFSKLKKQLVKSCLPCCSKFSKLFSCCKKSKSWSQEKNPEDQI